jgi:hypothetical protein
MAINKTLRYYRGDFNPEAAYGGSGQQSGIISMYNPESQAQFIDAVAKRQERFDTAKMAEAQEIARIGETETYDLPELNKRIKAFESGINDLVKNKYNGDYSAAANEIAKMIGTERTNPFYHFNKQKVEMSKAYLDAKMKLGSNFMSASNPMEVGFQDWQKGAKFDFTPINREDIVKDAAIEFGTLADTIMNDPTLRTTAGGQYFLSTVQSGLRDPRAVREFMESEEGQVMIQNIVDRNPEIAKLDREQVMGAVTEGAYSAIGKTQTQYLQNQDFISRAEKDSKSDDGYFNLITPSGTMATKKYFKGEDAAGNKLSAVKSFTINSTSPNRMETSQLNQLDNIKKNLGDQIKLLTFGDKPSEFTDFITKRSGKNVKQMDGSKPLEVTDIGFSEISPQIVLGVTGYDKDGNMLESVIALNAGDETNINTKVLNLIPYLERLGESSSEFNQQLYNWLAKNYPKRYQESLSNQ